MSTTSDHTTPSTSTDLDSPESSARPISDIPECSTRVNLGIPEYSTRANLEIAGCSSLPNLDIPGTRLDPAKDYGPYIGETFVFSNYNLAPTGGIHIRSGDEDEATTNNNLEISLPSVKETKGKAPCVKFTEPCLEMQTKGGPSIMNLRKWLEGDPAEIKAQRMDLFRKVLALVDQAHEHGIGLLDLRPSSFILNENGGVDYTGHILHSGLLRADRAGTRMGYSTRNISVYYAPYERLNEETSSEFEVKDIEELEKEWYGFPRGLRSVDLLTFNVYCLGLMLFEFLSNFESMEARSETMGDVIKRKLRQRYIINFAVEAGFCFWMMQPEPSSRPTTREILLSKYLNEIDKNEKVEYNNYFPIPNLDTEEECELLLYFLHILLDRKQNQGHHVSKQINVLTLQWDAISRALSSFFSRSDPDVSYTGKSAVRDKLLSNIDNLESAYFSMWTHSQRRANPAHHRRTDTDILRERDIGPGQPSRAGGSTVKEFQIGSFFRGICSFARCCQLKVCGGLNHRDIMNSYDAVNGLCLDRDEEFVAMAGLSKKIRIYEVCLLLEEDGADYHYPMVEMANPRTFSGICWNSYIRNYIVSSDYDGVVKIWDVSTAKEYAQFKEHSSKAWSVDISRINPTNFASGGDDRSVFLWTMNQRNSVGVIRNKTSVTCVQYSPYSSNMLAYGAADHHVYLYDLRHTKIPWGKMAGHRNSVSHVRFVDPETVVSASTDSTLKLWDLEKTTSEGLSTNACGFTYTGHTSERGYVGLATFEGYIACGSETNEVYMYHKDLPIPITSYKFESLDPTMGEDMASNGAAHLVSSVCWRKKTSMLFAANSTGSMRIFRME